MTKAVDLSGMALFVKIVECGSLSAAGRLLGLPKATISRQLGLMEQRMGAPLLRRSTRALSASSMMRRVPSTLLRLISSGFRAQSR